ncbi:MAG: redox-sensing transcriptional repressor Rex [Enterococcus aquimarinus]|nr:redox-sensing transcriptional repressor Rex [Enterococcus sp.]
MEVKEIKKLPKATAKRFPSYLRNLKALESSGVIRIKSKEFAEITHVPSATIRRDFSYLGELGRSGYGYEVPFLIEVFSNLLATEEEKDIALVGVGNLGKALLKNNFRRNENLNITCVFDSDPSLIGTVFEGYYIHSMDELAEKVAENGLTVAITTVPSHHSQEAVDVIVESGITAILNFAPDRVTVPDEVNVRYIDLTTELLTLIFFDNQNHYKMPAVHFNEQ